MANITHEGIVTIACSWAFALLALLSLSVAHLAQHAYGLNNGQLKRPMSPDQLLVYFTFLCSVVLTSLTTWAVLREGLYEHLNSVSYSQAELLAKSLFANEALWSLINTCFRVAACCFNRRMFPATPTVKVMEFMIVFSVLHLFAAVLGGFLICRPVSKSWNPALEGQCGNEFAAYLSFEIMGLSLDMAIILWPLRNIMGMNLSFRRKVNLTFIFGIGILVVVITGLRLKALTTVDFQDWSYSKGYLGLLSALGAYSSVILCTAFAIPVLIKSIDKSRPERRMERAKRREIELQSISGRFPRQSRAGPGMSAMLGEEAIDDEEEISLNDFVLTTL